MPLLLNILLVIIAVLLFCFIIFFHEFGHFITAKLSGVRVNEFALGMGPKLFSFTKGETKYSLRLLPIGGFCSMEGEDEASSDERAFCNKKVWKRMIIVVAGAILNIFLGIVLCFTQVVQEDVYLSTRLSAVGDAVQAENGDFLPGDCFYAVNGYRIMNAYDLNFSLSYTNGQENVEYQVKRGNEIITLNNVTIDYGNLTSSDEAYAFLVEPIDKNIGTVLTHSVGETVSITRFVWRCLIDIVTGKYSLKSMSGPVGTAQAITQAAAAGKTFGASVNNIIFVMALITVNLGVFNLLPLPALDGGRFFFMIIEAIRRKPVSPKAEGIVHAVGFALLMLLMVVVTYNDIARLITG